MEAPIGTPTPYTKTEIETLAQSVWIEARSVGVLNSQSATKHLTEIIQEIQKQDYELIDSLGARLAQELQLARKLIRSIRNNCLVCPVCRVKRGAKHRLKCCVRTKNAITFQPVGASKTPPEQSAASSASHPSAPGK